MTRICSPWTHRMQGITSTLVFTGSCTSWLPHNILVHGCLSMVWSALRQAEFELGVKVVTVRLESRLWIITQREKVRVPHAQIPACAVAAKGQFLTDGIGFLQITLVGIPDRKATVFWLWCNSLPIGAAALMMLSHHNLEPPMWA